MEKNRYGTTSVVHTLAHSIHDNSSPAIHARLSATNIYNCLYCCSVDNSDYMRNGDYLPTRLAAQADAVNLVCHAKTRQNQENNIGLVTLGG